MTGYAALPAIEGGFANLGNPFASVLAGPGALTAGPNGVILGRFGWADPGTGLVYSSRTPQGWTADSQIISADSDTPAMRPGFTQPPRVGFVLPQWGTWGKLYCDDGVWILREGLMVTLALRGDFWARFPGGASPGYQVWANFADGVALAYPSEWTADSTVVTADSVVYTADGGTSEPTPFTVMTPAAPGSLAVISSWQSPFH